MYKGEPTGGIDFYNLLVKSEEFTSELGKVVLVAGRLEAELIIFLKNNSVKENFDKATLGALIVKGLKFDLFDKSMINILKMITKQRNYLTHNIYALFTDQYDETILEKNNRLDSDVQLYIERAWELKENLNGIADIIHQKNVEKYDG